jgi:hypothetical protein
MPPEAPKPLNFISWQRSSLYDLVDDGDAHDHGRLAGTLKLALTDDKGSHADGGTPFHIVAPPDIAALDPACIQRMAPMPGASDAETTKITHVDFTDPNLPWQYSPVKSAESVRPWLALLVGTRSEITVEAQRGAVTVDGGVLADHDLTQSHLWAHVQDDGNGAFARLLCPRIVPGVAPPNILAPETDYIAVLVPAFDGNGNAAWQHGDHRSRTFSLLHFWTFRSTESGDFESLAKAIRPRSADGLGSAPLRYHRGEVSADLLVRGAITSLASDVDTADDLRAKADLQAYGDDVRALSGTDPLGRTVIGLPDYGAPWVADPTATDWTRQLNEDPRYRGSAGVGLWMGQEAQDDLVGAAVDQLGALPMAAHLMRGLAFGLAAAESLWDRRLPTDSQRQVDLFSPLMRRLNANNGTAMAAITGSLSPLDPALFSTAAKRMLRPGKAWTRHAKRPVTRRDTIAVANVCPTPPAATLAGLPHIDLLAETLGLPPAAEPHVLNQPPLTPEILEAIDAMVGLRVNWGDHDFLQRLNRLSLAIEHAVGGCELHAVYLREHDNAPLTREVLISAARCCVPGGEWHTSFDPSPLPHTDIDIFDVIGAIHDGVVTLLPEPAPHPCSPPDLDAVATAVATAVNPAGPNPPARRRVQSRINIDIGDLRPPVLPVGLDYATWILLRDRVKEWLLPGVGTLEKNSVVAMQTNPKFIDSYLVGLNTQLHNELHWRNIAIAPTATPLLMFWRHVNFVTGDREAEIQPISTWPDNSDLGDTTHQVLHPGDAGGNNDLVMVFRTDLFRRYPKTLVYLVRTPDVGSPDDVLKAPPTLTYEEQDRAKRIFIGPNFHGTLARDIVFFSFDVDPEHLAEYWLVLDEPAAQLRFRVFDGATDLRQNPASSAMYANNTIDHPTRVAFDGTYLQELGLDDVRQGHQ